MELLTPDEMGQADRLTIASAAGVDGYLLMQRAGQAVYQEIIRLWPNAGVIAILCGSGNNGGDGYIVAKLLKAAGHDVTCFASEVPVAAADAAHAYRDYVAEQGTVLPLAEFKPVGFDLAVDALLGAGLSRIVSGEIATCIEVLNRSGIAVCAIDLPSGVSGLSGHVLGTAVRADHTVTFFRKKPGHLLQPGRALCGQVSLHDIGISDDVFDEIHPVLFENLPDLWSAVLPVAETDTHKFLRSWRSWRPDHC